MSNSYPTEQELLKTILEPLLEDFQYWFSRARVLLESEKISFLSDEEQAKLLKKVQESQQEVRAAQALFKATDGQAGIDTATLVPWHQLVAQCWQVAMRWRSLKSNNS
jgi:predicted flavoprotein YhiN